MRFSNRMSQAAPGQQAGAILRSCQHSPCPRGDTQEDTRGDAILRTCYHSVSCLSFFIRQTSNKTHLKYSIKEHGMFFEYVFSLSSKIFCTLKQNQKCWMSSFSCNMIKPDKVWNPDWNPDSGFQISWSKCFDQIEVQCFSHKICQFKQIF